MYHHRNQIKQCPSCGQFLIKTEGCDGQTTCGDIPHGYDIPTTGRPWYTVIIQEVNGALKFMFQEYKNMLIGKSYPVTWDRFLVSELKPGAQLGLGGCGAQINWGTLPLLDGQTLQNVLGELKSTEDQAHRNLKKALKSKAKPKSDVEEMGILDENFQEHRRNYEETIDSSIKSQTLSRDHHDT
ncbi:hypothetical protein [Cardinium endosymbiont of Culicoides punctatus]|uniref:hypothetical protein n=1 Tax=Cardinium endosymbiont of Culicoides punctatus TaxID=2304601 RepID=UPI00105872B8|nr:hypothetical protein [Cardinium endosymbiont of Culicoides punctatus]TDG94945.1 hypothetical protein CCPUN_07010 [Cardinium endosymbiont of Culicoides punctatus]